MTECISFMLISMRRLGCREVSDRVLEELKAKTELFINKGNRAPSLAVVLVGENEASKTYVRKKEEAAEALGFLHFQYNFNEDVRESELISLIDTLNSDDGIDGILVQFPLPKHISEENIIERISAEKDVDGFSPVNAGRLMIGEKSFVPCTPKGILAVLRYYGIETAGKKAVTPFLIRSSDMARIDSGSASSVP